MIFKYSTILAATIGCLCIFCSTSPTNPDYSKSIESGPLFQSYWFSSMIQDSTGRYWAKDYSSFYTIAPDSASDTGDCVRPIPFSYWNSWGSLFIDPLGRPSAFTEDGILRFSAPDTIRYPVNHDLCMEWPCESWVHCYSIDTLGNCWYAKRVGNIFSIYRYNGISNTLMFSDSVIFSQPESLDVALAAWGDIVAFAEEKDDTLTIVRTYNINGALLNIDSLPHDTAFNCDLIQLFFLGGRLFAEVDFCTPFYTGYIETDTNYHQKDLRVRPYGIAIISSAPGNKWLIADSHFMKYATDDESYVAYRTPEEVWIHHTNSYTVVTPATVFYSRFRYNSYSVIATFCFDTAGHASFFDERTRQFIYQ